MKPLQSTQSGRYCNYMKRGNHPQAAWLRRSGGCAERQVVGSPPVSRSRPSSASTPGSGMWATYQPGRDPAGAHPFPPTSHSVERVATAGEAGVVGTNWTRPRDVGPCASLGRDPAGAASRRSPVSRSRTLWRRPQHCAVVAWPSAATIPPADFLMPVAMTG